MKNLRSDDVEALEIIHNKQIVRLENEYSKLEKRKANAETDKEKADLDKQADKTFERYDAFNEELADYQELKDLVVNLQNNPKDKEAKNQLQNKLNLVKDKLISRQEETSKSNVEKISSIPGQEKELDKKFQLLDREHNLYRNQQNQELLNNSQLGKKGKEQQEDARNKRLQGKKILDDYADRLDSESRQEFDEELRRLDLEWTQRSQLVTDPKVTGKAQHKEEFEKQKAEIQEIKDKLANRVSESFQDDIDELVNSKANIEAKRSGIRRDIKHKRGGGISTADLKSQDRELISELKQLDSEIEKLEREKNKVIKLQKGGDDVVYIKPKVIATQTISQSKLPTSEQEKIQNWAGKRRTAQIEKTKYEKDSEEYKKENQKMIAASEQMGEIAADAAIDKIHPGAKPLKFEIPGGGKQGQFDRVYEDTNGKIIIIVEAKGAGADLGTRKIGKGIETYQGTPQYRDSILENMGEKAEKISDEKAREKFDATVRKIEKAKKKGNLVYYLISQPVKDDGTPKDIKVKQFSNTESVRS
ncbi:MAG: hypothetical protein ACFBSE_27060 [Prochloraceae cyanobacterium]